MYLLKKDLLLCSQTLLDARENLYKTEKKLRLKQENNGERTKAAENIEPSCTVTFLEAGTSIFKITLFQSILPRVLHKSSEVVSKNLLMPL